MAAKVHFKFRHGKFWQRFVLPTNDPELFDRLKTRVEAVRQGVETKMWWDDGETRNCLDDATDVDAAIAHSVEKAARIDSVPCIIIHFEPASSTAAEELKPSPIVDVAPVSLEAVPMSYDEKRQLSLDISSLPGVHLSRIIQIIEERERIPEFSPDEVEVDFENLLDSTLRAVEAYVATCYAKANDEPKQELQEPSAGPEKNEKDHEDFCLVDAPSECTTSSMKNMEEIIQKQKEELEELRNKREEELKHAMDIRDMYEIKLLRVNKLYARLTNLLDEVDEREEDLAHRERLLNERCWTAAGLPPLKLHETTQKLMGSLKPITQVGVDSCRRDRVPSHSDQMYAPTATSARTLNRSLEIGAIDSDGLSDQERNLLAATISMKQCRPTDSKAPWKLKSTTAIPRSSESEDGESEL